ncbi:ulp1 protease family, C-terminal catalytic domain-containing protein [Tanacetum coccineum]
MDIRDDVKASKGDELPKSSLLSDSDQNNPLNKLQLSSGVKGIDRVSPIKSKGTGNSDSPRSRRITMSERDMLVSSNPQPVSQFNPITGELIMSSANVNFSGIAPVVSDKLTDLEKDKVNVGKDKALKHKLTDLEKDEVNVGNDKASKHKASVKNPAAVLYKARKQKTPVKKPAAVVEKPDAVVDKAPKHKAPAKKPASVVVQDKDNVTAPAKEQASVVVQDKDNVVVNDPAKVGDVVNDSLVVESVCDVVKASDALKNKAVMLRKSQMGRVVWLLKALTCLTKTTAMTILDNSPRTYDSKYKEVCDLLKKLFARHLKEYGHIRHAKIAKLKQTIPKLKWKTKVNFHDCRIFTMLHMETFNGGHASSFDCKLPAESQLHRDMLRRLRFKFVTKILLHEINVLAEKMLELAKEFDKIDHVEKMAIIIDAFKNRGEHRSVYLLLLHPFSDDDDDDFPTTNCDTVSYSSYGLSECRVAVEAQSATTRNARLCGFSYHHRPVLHLTCLSETEDVSEASVEIPYETDEDNKENINCISKEGSSTLGGVADEFSLARHTLETNIEGSNGSAAVTSMDEARRKTKEFVEDPIGDPRRIMEQWKSQLIDELPAAFCGKILRNLDPKSKQFTGELKSHDEPISDMIITAPMKRLMNENTQENNIQKVDLEVISRETIKSTSPTPHHQRTFNLSIIDNILFDVYTPLILFLPNTNKASVTDVVTKRSKHLNEALSQILTQFYPLARKIMDNLHIECNDEGVYYKETRVNQALNDFLSEPDDPKVRELMPEHPRTSESSVGNFLLGEYIQLWGDWYRHERVSQDL